MTLDEAGIGIEHHFGGGVYAKLTKIPAGTVLDQHRHKFDHLSALMQGVALVTVDGETTAHTAPAMLLIQAGKVHRVNAVSDVVWACIHATNETDPDLIDHELIQ